MSQYLHGAFIPKQQKLSAIAEALDVAEGWLMGYDVPRRRLVIDEKISSKYIEMTAPDDYMNSAHILKGAKVIIRPLPDSSEPVFIK